jgi:peptidoglycan/xylan/chitin deacetylase (PgdA/CDA1 family)
VRAILTYHSIDESGSPISIARDEFDRHVAWLASGQVKVVPLDCLLTDPGPDLVAITFDDGFKNFALSAAPRLAERGLPVTLFIVSDRVGLTNAWGDRPAPGIPNLELLTWDQIRTLAESGVTIGSHTRRHPRLTRLGPEQLDDELAGSADRLERELGSRPRWFAYPYGEVDAEVSRRARSHYQGAVTTEHRPVRPDDDSILMPRLDAIYFRRAETLARWGSLRFKGSIWARRQARRARAAFLQTAGTE